MSMSKNKIPCSHLLNRNIIIIINMLYYHTYYNSEKKLNITKTDGYVKS